MANVGNAYVRFYPINGQLSKSKFLEAYSDLKNQLWRSWYYFDEIENCIDVVYPSKSFVRFDLFTDKRIVDNYHIWIRTSDYSCYEDLLGFKSKFYQTTNITVGEKCKIESGFTDEWNFATSCLYSADEILIKFNTTESDYLERLIKSNRYNTIVDKIDDNMEWRCKLMINYFKSSQTSFENDCTGEHIEQNYYESEFGWSDSHIWGIMQNERLIQIKTEFLDCVFQYDKDSKPIKFEETIDELQFLNRNKVVHSFKWKFDSEWNESRWIDKTTSSWDNLINPEFIKFKETYRIKN